MLSYILRRSGYSILIIFGVLIVTFLLFRVAAGDPAAAVLGKNPSPEEVELMREKLGSDKPLFWGRWKTSLIYQDADFRTGRTVFPHVERSEPSGRILFHRNFLPAGGARVRIEIEGAAAELYSPSGEKLPETEPGVWILDEAPDRLEVNVPSGKDVAVKFFRPTKHLFDSQALASLTEVVHFQSAFPYVSFFDFGETLLTRESIRGRLWRGMWPSLFLMIPIFFGELLCGIVLAMLSCVWHGRWPDRVIMIFSVAGMSISYLALIIFGQWFFGYWLNLFPVWGWGSPRFLILPVIIGIVSGTGGGARFYRTVFLNEAGREYLRTAKAKGLSPFKVYFVHMLKNSLVPIITRASTILPFLFTGSLLLESFFGIPGLGYEGINALNDSDLQMLKALVILGALLFVVINLLTDVAYAWVDPRMRPRSGGDK
ncbi:MAG: ABC transporter permease [Lentisphaeria bacterium]|nr:ABC transporter permease [Lentisphaeria bacterium]